MTKTVIHAIGPGRDHETLAAWAEALPADLVPRDEIHVAELYAGRDDPGRVRLASRCDETRYLVIRAAQGHGFAALTNPVADVLAPGQGLGATVRATDGDAIRLTGPDVHLQIEGLQILAEDGVALANDAPGGVVAVEACLIEAVSSAPAICLPGPDSRIAASVVLQRGGGDGIILAEGASAEGVTVFKPARALADGTGISGPASARARSAVAMGFRQSFGGGLLPGRGAASDQVNVLSAATNFADPAWVAVRASVDAFDTVPGPFAVPLQWLSNNQSGFARFDHDEAMTLPPGARMSFQAIFAAPTAFSSGLALVSPAGEVALKVNWIDTPPSTALVGRPAGLAAVGGGLEELAPGLYRLRVSAENRTRDFLSVRPVVQVTAGLENAGLNVGSYVGCAMAGPGHLGAGFVDFETSALVAHPGIAPGDALRSDSGILPDMRPIEGGPLDVACAEGGADILGRPRLSPETLGAFTLNPVPGFVATPFPRVPRPSAKPSEERPRP